jgi:hypothetical protein
MSTRATYTFKDETSNIHVYKHHDGYPEGAAGFIAESIKHAWDLPRFEADAFAAAFVAANKSKGGGIRLYSENEDWRNHIDIEYHYTITCNNGVPQVQADEVSLWDDTETINTIFRGSLAEFIKTYKPEAA